MHTRSIINKLALRDALVTDLCSVIRVVHALIQFLWIIHLHYLFLSDFVPILLSIISFLSGSQVIELFRDSTYTIVMSRCRFVSNTFNSFRLSASGAAIHFSDWGGAIVRTFSQFSARSARKVAI